MGHAVLDDVGHAGYMVDAMTRLPEILRLAEAELSEVNAQLGPLLQRQAALQAIIRSASLGEVRGENTETPQPMAPTPTGNGAPTITFSATRILNSVRRPMTAGEITKRLLDSGFRMNAQNPTEVVRSTLSRRSDRFERVGVGLYALTGWPADAKKVSANGASAAENE